MSYDQVKVQLNPVQIRVKRNNSLGASSWVVQLLFINLNEVIEIGVWLIEWMSVTRQRKTQ